MRNKLVPEIYDAVQEAGNDVVITGFECIAKCHQCGIFIKIIKQKLEKVKDSRIELCNFEGNDEI